MREIRIETKPDYAWSPNFLNALREYANAIVNAYEKTLLPTESTPKMMTEFEEAFHIVVGTKYAKIVTNYGVHSFVVLNDLGNPRAKFKTGTILKAASWNSPSKNFGRGNIFELSTLTVRWTGA